MRSIRTILSVLLAAVVLTGSARAQEDGPPPAQQQQQQDWPRSFTTDDGTVIKIYEPQPEAFTDNVLKSRWAISVTAAGKDPVFGTFWSVANVETDRDNRRVIIQSVKVPNVKFPGQTDENFISSLKTALETNLPSAAGDLSLDELLSGLDMNTEQKKLSKDLNTTAPRIIYSDKPALLVMIDGQPKLQQNKDWNLDVVVNTPFTIVKANNGGFYLYGGKRWYQAQSATGPYSPAGSVPSELDQVKNAVDNANSSNAGYIDSASAAQDSRVSDIIVSTSPAELIQTDGKPNFTAIPGTNLSYASNSSNDLFQDGGSGKYFVLIAGRWYSSGSLTGGWHYVASNSLPADFAKIPEGSPKDNVLASVAGTDAAREAIMDAQVPQTAKVDRNSASTSVNYNGEPQFSPLQGTDMQYGTNTSSSVILDHGIYYTVDNGVWFQAPSPNGPWTVATERPDEVDRIPPSSPLYNTKYVYIYDVTPDYVYMGYTPGYLNTYIYGPTVVYGTGFYYDPWYNGFYYPRPWTWGFNVCYNPWAGWTLGYGYGFGWFHFGLGFHGGWGGWAGGGWWGPHVYRPVYAWNRYRSHGFYGSNFYRNRNVYVNNYHTNIYAGRGGVVTRDNHTFYNRSTIGRGATFSRPGAPAAGRPGAFNNGFNNGGRPAGPQGGRPGGFARPGASNNVFSDRSGNVYQRNPTTNQWQQRSNNSWQPVRNNPGVQQNLNRQQQMRDRGFTRQQNFQQSRGFGGGGGFSRPSGGGFSRPSGGGGGSRPSGGGGSSRPGRH
ncbi:MAG TPA: hypothetical protein VHE34_18595 [Puia sp.]|uniref:hypothetical protein n=1 Tax=Puia sp. TaxID=2045100 RepID=UPI002B74C6BC|nr:hypothetical protein [Puia sp.]HVU97249.1 hypothetical protein [Puia sp.]